MIQLVCPKCRQVTHSAEDLAAGPVSCPACGHCWRVSDRLAGTDSSNEDGAPPSEQASAGAAAGRAEARQETEAAPAPELPAGLPEEVYRLGTPTAVYENRVVAEGGWRFLLRAVLPSYRNTTFLRAALVYSDRLVLVMTRPFTGVAAWPRRQERSVLTFPWDDITVWVEVLGGRQGLFRLEGPVPVESQDSIFAPPGFRVRRRDGEEVVLRAGLDLAREDLFRLEAAIQDGVARRLLSRSAEIYHSGGTVEFGPLHLSHTGLGKGRETIPWAEVKRIRVDQGVIAVEKEQLQRRVLANVMEVPNVVAFLALLRAAGIPVEEGRDASTGEDRTDEGPRGISAEGEGAFDAMLAREAPEALPEAGRLGTPRAAYKAGLGQIEATTVEPAMIVTVGCLALAGSVAAAAHAQVILSVVAAIVFGLPLIALGVILALPAIRTIGPRLSLLLAVLYLGTTGILISSFCVVVTFGLSVLESALGIAMLLADALVVAVAALLLWRLRGRVTLAALVFSQGLLFIRRLELFGRYVDIEVLRWEDVAEVRRDVIVIHGQSSVQRVPSCTLLRRDGKRLVLAYPLPDVEKLTDMVERETTRRLLPGILEACLAGERVRFGPISASQKGLHHESESSRRPPLPWDGLESARITQDHRPHLVIRQADRGRDWFVVPAGRVPNVRVLLGLADHFAKQRAGGRVAP